MFSTSTVKRLMLGVMLVAPLATAQAQGTFADKSLVKIVGNWLTADARAKSRFVKFFIKDGNAMFEDAVQPGLILTGVYRQDDNGGAYVMNYSSGFQCRYTVSYLLGADDGNSMTLRLVEEYSKNDARFKCVEGRLDRAR